MNIIQDELASLRRACIRTHTSILRHGRMHGRMDERIYTANTYVSYDTCMHDPHDGQPENMQTPCILGQLRFELYLVTSTLHHELPFDAGPGIQGSLFSNCAGSDCCNSSRRESLCALCRTDLSQSRWLNRWAEDVAQHISQV